MSQSSDHSRVQYHEPNRAKRHKWKALNPAPLAIVMPGPNVRGMSASLSKRTIFESGPATHRRVFKQRPKGSAVHCIELRSTGRRSKDLHRPVQLQYFGRNERMNVCLVTYRLRQRDTPVQRGACKLMEHFDSRGRSRHTPCRSRPVKPPCRSWRLGSHLAGTVGQRSSTAHLRAKSHEQLTAVVQGRAPARDDRTWWQTGRRRCASEAGVLRQSSGRLVLRLA